MPSFKWQSTLPHPIEQVFKWHTLPGAFERLNPPWRPVKVVHSTGSIEDGNKVVIKLPIIGDFGISWALLHKGYNPPNLFCDEQIRGPFKTWLHSHRFISEDADSTLLLDQIDYELPLVAKPLNYFFKRELKRLFTHRHLVLANDLKQHGKWSDKPRQTILIAGASGFVGTALKAFLSTAGHTVLTLVRRAPQNQREFFWDPAADVLNPETFSGVDAVINLCGDNIASGRWNAKKKILIKDSRVIPTTLLARVIANLSNPPKLFVNASATGFYGDTGDSLVDESSAAGDDFLANVGVAWEEALNPLKDSPCRVVATRIGVVINGAGGALAKMLTPFLMGLGGHLGNGKQYMSWIALQDLLGIFEQILFDDTISGAVNIVSPNPCSNREFTKTLGRVIKRPTLLPVPATILKLALGEMSKLLLASNRVIPGKLITARYNFIYPDLESALRAELG